MKKEELLQILEKVANRKIKQGEDKKEVNRKKQIIKTRFLKEYSKNQNTKLAFDTIYENAKNFNI